ncbi:MAG: SH3 domain-containing protein [Anaerolineae bacterium]|nr:SH3 domain-containing protein [Anaerolineae bacterium]
MSLDTNNRPTRSGPNQDLWPKWMWIAVPVLVVIVVAGLWWAIFYPSESPAPTPTPTPTVRVIRNQPTQAPTLPKTLPPQSTPTVRLLPTQPLPSPTPVSVVTPTSPAPTAPASGGLAIGKKAKVTGTGRVGLNVRAGAGTGHARIKTLPEGSIVEIIGGPKEANGYTWWQIRDKAGTTGWAAGEYLAPQ